MKTIDINCDVGEGIANEHLLMPYISSCNIACGGHYGTKETIDQTIELAIKNNVLIGAHPSFPDKENFGRKIMDISQDKLQKSIESQLSLFMERLSRFNRQLHHVKPHGALYNLIAIDEDVAEIVVKSIKKQIKNCYLYVPYLSVIERVAVANEIKIRYEAFADRNYNDNRTLVSRTLQNALIQNPEDVLRHVNWMLKKGTVKTISGIEKAIQVDTFCVHGDTKNALEIVQFLHKNLI